MQHVCFVPDGVEIPDGVTILGPAFVNHRSGKTITPGGGWVVVPGICCDQWAITREPTWDCPSCGTPYHQPSRGLWAAAR